MGTIAEHSGLGAALFTKTQRQVLGLLFGHPEQSFYLNEIVRSAGVGIGTVQRELEKLARTGLLKVSKVGNQKHYQANSNAPIFDERAASSGRPSGSGNCCARPLPPWPGGSPWPSSTARSPKGATRPAAMSICC